MAEAINYRMNLVIDPKNVIKANRELRAMERYFERIQGRVLKIGRTRMVPEIMLKDSASKGLDSLLSKINRVKSQMLHASANMNLNVKQSGGQGDFSGMVQALGINTDALNNLTNALGSLQFGGGGAAAAPEKPKTMWDKIKDGFAAAKSIGSGVKSATEVPGKIKAVGQAWKGKKPEDSKKADGNNNPGATEEPAPITKSRKERIKEQRFKGLKKGWNTTGALGDLVSTIGSAGSDIIGGFQGFGKLFGGKGSGIVSSIIKGGGKKLLGPLGFAADAVSIATAGSGKERAQAIGSSVGGGMGAALGGILGSVIPVGGTLVGSTLGGAVGGYVGEKVGGWVSDNGSKIKKSVSDWFSGTFSFGKKVKPAQDFSGKPAIMTSPSTSAISVLTPSSMMPGTVLPAGFAPAHFTSPANPFGPILPTGQATAANGGPRIQAAVSNKVNESSGKITPQVVQISPEQMTTLSGSLKDFKTETMMNYNLPPGAVQVTVHEDHPVDVEGLILQIGQRLRAEFIKAAQNRKPVAKPYV